MNIITPIFIYKNISLFLLLSLFSVFAYSITPTQPTISIIIDDIGYKKNEDIRALSLPGPIAYAILPHAPYTKKMVSIASKNMKEILLHQPMQATKKNKLLGPGALTLDMTKKEFIKTLEINIDNVSNIIGINNHMGSLLTRHPGHMQWLMTVIKKNNYVYIDSLTSASSVAERIAKKNDVPFLSRDIFLDNENNKEHIKSKFLELIEIAKKQGTALAIGHPYSNTIETLSKFLEDLDMYGVKLIGVKSLIKKRINIDN